MEEEKKISKVSMEEITQEGMTLNERILKITGSMCIDESLKLGKDIGFNLKCSVVDVNIKDKHNGTYDLIFNAKMLGI